MPFSTFVEHFATLPDPRVARGQLHSLHDVLVIALLAVLSGAEGWEDMEEFGKLRQTWLRERLGLTLENGTPSDDTFRRVLWALDPDAFQRCFRAFTKTLCEEARGEVVCVDGKTLRHSFDTACGQAAVHLVRAWASENRLVLGALPTEEGSNEIPAVRALLALLDLRGALVTADAEHTQKETAAQIRSQGGDYLLSLKRNHKHLHEDCRLCFERLASHVAAPKEWVGQAQGRSFSRYREHDGGHGRYECRKTTVLGLSPHDPEWGDVQAQWPDLSSLVCVERTRQAGEQTTQESAYYLSSRTMEAKRMGRLVRGHWSIENRLHYVLDVSFGEDASCVRRGHAPENLAALRDLALSLLHRNTTSRRGIKARRKRAGWDPDYLLELLA